MQLWIALGVLVAICVLWRPLFALFAGGRVSYANSPVGIWVGEMEITGGADSANLGGNTPGPHTHGVLYANLEIEDRFMDKYAGHGELVIVGEHKVRPITVFVHLLQNGNGLPNADGGILTHPPLAGSLSNTHYESNRIVMISDGPLDLQFKATLHRGTLDEYHALLSRFPDR